MLEPGRRPQPRTKEARPWRGRFRSAVTLVPDTYRCTNCSYELGVQSVTSLPPCPECDGPYAWEALTGGDAADDPYPDGA